MTSYKSITEGSTDGDLLQRAQVALVKCALAIQSEAADTPNHATRSSLAYAVLHDPVSYARLMLLGMLVAADARTLDDAGMFTQASAVWNAYALGAAS